MHVQTQSDWKWLIEFDQKKAPNSLIKKYACIRIRLFLKLNKWKNNKIPRKYFFYFFVSLTILIKKEREIERKKEIDVPVEWFICVYDENR